MNQYIEYETIFSHMKNNDDLLKALVEFHEEHLQDLEQNKTNPVACSTLRKDYNEMVSMIEKTYYSRSTEIQLYIELNLK